jgi:hypothetical protein
VLADPRARRRILYVNSGPEPIGKALEAALAAPS